MNDSDEDRLLAEGAREFADEDAALAEELLNAVDLGLTGSDLFEEDPA